MSSVGGRVHSRTGALPPKLGRIDATSRRALAAFLRTPRYEVLPTEDVEDRLLATVPTEVTITITASPRKGLGATLALAERLARPRHPVGPPPPAPPPAWSGTRSTFARSWPRSERWAAARSSSSPATPRRRRASFPTRSR